MDRPNYLKELKKIILAAKGGTVFVSTDFLDIADKKTVDVGLARLCNEGLIRRLFRGVYEKPERNDFLGEYVAPFPDKVALALARNYNWTIIPCGDTALNLLGLSTQVPATWLYISDGPYKNYRFDGIILRFKKTANKEISKMSYKTALIVQAIKALGKNGVDEKVIFRLQTILTYEEKVTLLREAKTVTSWVYESIKQICRG